MGRRAQPRRIALGFCALTAGAGVLASACSGDPEPKPVAEAEGSSLAKPLGAEIASIVQDLRARGERAAAMRKPRAGSDLVWNEEEQILAPCAADQFGASVALQSDLVLLGAPDETTPNGPQAGVVYVFQRQADGSYAQMQKITAQDGADGDHFGAALAVSGDWALIGAPGKDHDNRFDAGVVYFYKKSGASFGAPQKVMQPIASDDARFGASVSISSDAALIGAPGEQADVGAAYLVARAVGNDQWTPPVALPFMPPGAGATPHFGAAVAIEGITAVVGAPVDDGGAQGSGAAYVFTKNGGGFSPPVKLKASDGQLGDEFGAAVAVSDSGDLVLVGAKQRNTGRGAVYRFDPANPEQPTLLMDAQPSELADYSHFGSSIALQGGVAIVGADELDGSGTRSGTAYVFASVKGELPAIPQRQIKASNAQAGAAFGASVATDGIKVVVGAPFLDVVMNCTHKGYVFTLPEGNGSPCVHDVECTAGFCVDGVCCESACGGGAPEDCWACAKSAGAVEDGVCAARTGALCDDHNPCTMSDLCDSDGLCKAGAPKTCEGDTCNDAFCNPVTGACNLLARPNGTPCSDGNACTTNERCDVGECKGDEVSCKASSACDYAYCDPAIGCVEKRLESNAGDQSLENGEPCCDDSSCKSGHCADGVCCDVACEGICYSCVVPGDVGTCKPQPKGVDFRGECGAPESCTSTCSGAVNDGEPHCIPAVAGSQCTPPRCSADGTQSLGGVCRADNAGGIVCTQEETECGAFRCNEIHGECSQGCKTASDCAAGFACDNEYRCVLAAPRSEGIEPGCFCSVPTGERRGTSAALALLSLGLLVARRSRRSR